MASVRELCDRIEESGADELWTLPKYREMLFFGLSRSPVNAENAE